VSNWGATTISVVDVSGATPTVTATVPVGTHPTAMLLNPVNHELYVANADSDTISVLDTSTNHVVRTIDLRSLPGIPFGAGPNGLAISKDGRTLYVANAFDNDIEVVRLARKGNPDQIQGLIPTGWIPSGVVLSPEDQQLAVINSKGLGAGPNLQGPNPYLDPESADNQYVGSMIVGTLSLIDVPDHGELREDTHQVFVNDHFFGAEEAQGENSSTATTAGSSSGQRGDFESAVSPRDTFFALLAGTPVGPGTSEQMQSTASSSGSLATPPASGIALPLLGKRVQFTAAAAPAASPNTKQVPADLGAGVSEAPSNILPEAFRPFANWPAPGDDALARLK